jgi:hypothetical protein
MKDQTPPAASTATVGNEVVLPIARYRFTATACGEVWMPDYAGSLLRGIFGAALRRTVCMTGMAQCPPCPLHKTCPYPAIFEAPQRPTSLRQQFSQVANPYVIEPPPAGRRRLSDGESITFHMVLIGQDALDRLPLILYAWQRALAHGVGADRVAFKLQTVEWVGGGQSTPIWMASDGRVAEHAAGLRLPDRGCDTDWSELSLHIDTPLRLQHNGKPLFPAALSVRALLLAAARRVTLLQDLYLQTPTPHLPPVTELLKALPAIRDDRSQLRWLDWTRFSARQRQEMTLGGVVGIWRLSGNVAVAWPWLWVCQWLHIGKNATMGLGGYRLVPSV